MVNSGSIAVSDNLNNRTTSHAKTVDLTEHNSALDRARALKEAFEHAKASRQHSLEQEKPREPDPASRSTSHAKTVDLGEQKNSLDRAAALKSQFEQAHAMPVKAREQDNVRQPENISGPPHAPRAEQHLRPQGEIRRAVDRQIDKEMLARENERARQVSEAYKARLNQTRQNRNKDMDRDI
jgi:hypothetical protein